MTRSRLALALVLLLPAAAAACLWDYDTLAQERSRFPSALELITGKYLRHSPEFYEWRVKDRRKKLASDPGNLALHDDLVVALDRLGKYDEALVAVEAANKLQPNRYETESNWGTVLLHAGKLEDGLAHIDAAVRINPDAHFGREVYQQKLVRWVLDAHANGRTLPIGERGHGFLEVVGSTNRDAALKGVLGMMRSGQHDNPLLLESLASLLTDGLENRPDIDAKQLAARAYLRAADVVPEVAAQAAYRERARTVLNMQAVIATEELPLERVEQDFRRELAGADTWFARLRTREIAWVSGEVANPDAEFDKLYATEPTAVGGDDILWTDRQMRTQIGIGVVCVGLFAAVVAGFGWCVLLSSRRLRRGAKISAPTPQP